MLQVSSVHAYLAYPFVLSWSLLEAMAAGAFVVGSATPPVEEVIAEGETGWLVDFFDEKALAKRVAEALSHRSDVDDMRHAARRLVQSRYELTECLNAQLDLIDTLANDPTLTRD